jgi:type IV pilus assembly protein PilY1
MIFSFFSLAFLPGDVSGGSCSNSLSPPFIATGVKPNILIILDNSNSMDEDFYGNAVGSYSPASKTVVAKQALQKVVQDLQGKANVGIMTYSLPGDIVAMQIHNAMPFASYNPNSYCPNPPPECTTYCMNPADSAAQAACDAGCPPNPLLGQTYTSFTGQLFTHNDGTQTNFTDLIITHYPPTTDPNSTRARYCGLVYPKTQMWSYNDPLGFTTTVYYNQTDPFYDWGDDGILFGYAGSDSSWGVPYSPAENANNGYVYCPNKKGPSDSFQIYTGPSGNSTSGCYYYMFEPTDSDWALGFYNWGQEMPWYWVGPTWFSWSQASGSPQGYLHVPVGDLTNPTQFNNVYNVLNPMLDLVNGVYTGTLYMSCNASNMNTCPYIVNASNTPTAGTLNTAFNYFDGKLSGQSSPITSICQKNYIIYATDGLPSTFMNGSQPTPNPAVMADLIQEVLTQLGDLQTNVTQTFNGTNYTFPVKTYVLGMGLTTQAKANLDQMAVAGGTVQPSGHAYYADNPSEFTDALNSIITDLLSRVAAGSSISILSEGQTQNGANMLQGVFYPQKYYGTAMVSWPGYLYDYWFYNSATYSNIREDTVHDFILQLNEDYGISFVFDPQNGLSVDRFADPTGSGNPSVFVNSVGLDSLTPIWEAGKLLFQTTAASRQIYTPGINANGSGLVSFNSSNPALTMPVSSPLGSPSNFDPCLQVSSTNPNWQTLTLQNLINYVRGTDLPTCRNRTVGLCSNGTAFNNTACMSNSDCTTSPYTTCTQNVWKLGDIVYSTPQVQADYKYCSNGTSYNGVLCSQDSDCTLGAYTSCQKKQSVIFVGANDGMLHAFQTGVLSTAGLNASQSQVVELAGIATSSMGQELWAFIPQNSLPYLRCLAVPPPGSCHLYYNDLSPYITTMVSNGVSKTVLIGGMRLGGGAVNSTGNYCFNGSGVSNGQPCTNNANCTTAPYNLSCSSAYVINAPSDTCTPVTCVNPATCNNPPGCTGLSSYYALDITDAQNPILLWEFSHPFLGYSYSGPAVIHKWSNPANLSGDQYYVMFLSGPTDPVHGNSIQDVQTFVLSLNANLGISSVYYKDLGATTQNGFGGRLFTPGLDVNGDGYTDFVFFGYGNSPNGSSTGWQGGIGKVNTNNINATLALNPADWTYDVTTYANIATLPITARIATEQCFNTWYLYAGTGRYFFPQDNYGPTGNPGLNYVMGLPFTCDQYNNNCGSISSLNNSTTACTNLQASTNNPSALYAAAWEYTLSAGSGTFLNERLITDPTIDPGTPSNPGDIIYFITSEPTSDPCGYGGQSRVWGLNCATGAAITDQSCSGYTVPSANLTGTMYLQTSTGAIYQIDAATSFTDSSTGNRTTQWFIGMPPETSPPLVQPDSPATRSGQLIQWIEK